MGNDRHFLPQEGYDAAALRLLGIGKSKTPKSVTGKVI